MLKKSPSLSCNVIFDLRKIHMPAYPLYSCILRTHVTMNVNSDRNILPKIHKVQLSAFTGRPLVHSLCHSVCLTVFISPDVIILAANFRLLRKLPADLSRFCVDFLKDDESLKSESQSVRNGLSTE